MELVPDRLKRNMGYDIAYILNITILLGGPGGSFGIATELRAGKVRDRIPVGTRFTARPDRSWDPPSLLYIGYRVFSGSRGGRGVGLAPTPPSSAEGPRKE